MIRKKESLLYLFVFIILLSGFLILGKPSLAIPALVMFVYATLALFFVYFSGRNIEVEIYSSGERRKDETISLSGRVKNHSLFPVFRFEGRLMSLNKLVGDKQESFVELSLGPREDRLFQQLVENRNYGVINGVLMDAGVLDPLGLFEKKVLISEEDAVTVVFPDYRIIPIDSASLDVYDMESYRYVDGKSGGDTSETVGIKEYQPGDNIRSIHWKLTAKSEVPMIKEAGFPVSSRVTVVLDKRINEDDDYGDMNSLTEFGLSFSKSLLDLGVHHKVCWETMDYGRDFPETVTYEVKTEDDFYGMSLRFLGTGFFKSKIRSYNFSGSVAEKHFVITNNVNLNIAEEDIISEIENVEILIPGKIQ